MRKIFYNYILKFIFYLFLKPIVLSNRFFHYKTKNLVIINLNKIGDTILSFPAINVILKQYSDYCIKIITYHNNIALFEKYFSPSQEIIPIERKDFYWKNRIAKRKIRRLLMRLKPNLIIDFTGSFETATMFFNLRAKEVMGFNYVYFKVLYTKFIPREDTSHLMDKYFKVIDEKLIDNIDIKSFPIKINSELPIIIHPFAGWEAKEWEFKKFIKLYELLSVSYNCKFIIENTKRYFKHMDIFISKNITFDITNNQFDLINSIDNSSVFIGNDSGLAHIASMLGKPTFVVYGPTNPYFHKPYSDKSDFVIKILPCSPKENKKYCHTFGGRKGCKSFECMLQLSVEEVIEKVLKFLKKNNIKQISL
ncbi:MAG: glycosyltransferase family 9 protein [Ignavibacteriales bacterium]|nr:glycosyltransferase family 9 protein [Ignavibacteriales bacterium]